MLHISSAFDGGNIEVLDTSEPGDMRLRIRPDHESEALQWFYFRMTGAAGQACVLHLTNAGDASYPAGYEDYSVIASYDRDAWFRVPTTFDGKVLTVRHTPRRDLVYYAYFVPYSLERHADLIARSLRSPRVHLEVLGQTLDGQDLEMLRIGEAKAGRLPLWFIARQHPAAAMAGWWMDGFLSRLLDPDDAVARWLLERAVVYAVPNMNPDGCRRGHHRTNASGTDLNRSWQTPSLEYSPEVYLVRERMFETNASMVLDVHGQEAEPHVFILSFEGIPNERSEQRLLLHAYKQRLAELNPDFDIEQPIPYLAPGEADLRICSKFMAESFGALSMSLEMPFKDTVGTPHPDTGWSPQRSRQLGRSCLTALRPVIDRLR